MKNFKEKLNENLNLKQYLLILAFIVIASFVFLTVSAFAQTQNCQQTARLNFDEYKQLIEQKNIYEPPAQGVNVYTFMYNSSNFTVLNVFEKVKELSFITEFISSYFTYLNFLDSERNQFSAELCEIVTNEKNHFFTLFLNEKNEIYLQFRNKLIKVSDVIDANYTASYINLQLSDLDLDFSDYKIVCGNAIDFIMNAFSLSGALNLEIYDTLNDAVKHYLTNVYVSHLIKQYANLDYVNNVFEEMLKEAFESAE